MDISNAKNGTIKVKWNAVAGAEGYNVYRADSASGSYELVKEVEGAYAYRCPWYFPGKGWCHAMSWGQSHPDATLSVVGRAADADAVGTALAGKAPADFGAITPENNFLQTLSCWN